MITINTEYEHSKVSEIVNEEDIKVNSEEEETKSASSSVDLESGIVEHTKKVCRTGTLSQFPHLNECSDKMLEYEMKRMMGFSN